MTWQWIVLLLGVWWGFVFLVLVISIINYKQQQNRRLRSVPQATDPVE